ncbi:amino acid adenylation domain-containing protein [Nocardia sp. NBC_00508]|uniref:non-ribosomal peptide synthetase n=1 Tax=Nocardia sp. NBC_00508 TaxID=2975992 RepID=UPI002E80E1EA|nr:amino acid adenylation domain-containing protein [Nocardia sp. NBC_00508]WUD66556.1 amino acid adenylation domain-containing protein [Nocardia sp. NBC_00508]
MPIPDIPDDSVRDLAIGMGASFRQIWLALFAALVHRYTGETDFLVAEATAKGLLAHRVDLAGSPGFRELVGRVTAESGQVPELLGPIPAESLLELVQPEARASERTPFTAAFGTSLDVSGTGATDIAELTVVIDRGVLVYHPERCSRADAELIAGHLATLTAAVLADPDRPVRGLPILAPHERATLLVEWNATAVPVEPFRTLQARIAELAVADPGRPAVVDATATVTFGELDRAADRLAAYLGSVGVQRGDRVGILLERSAANVISLLAILRSGASAVPLDPSNPHSRTAFMLDDSGATAVVTVDAMTPQLAGTHGLRVISLDGDAAAIGSAVASAPPPDPEPDDICHVFYTSGSTGQPKAVLERHGAMANMIAWTGRACGVTRGDRATWISSPGFSVGLMEWIPFLANGTTVYTASADAARDPKRLRDWLIENAITHTLLVSSAAERVWSLDWPDLCALRYMVVAGEQVRRWPRAGLPFEVVVSYGSTETTLVASTFDAATGLRVTSATVTEAERDSPPPIGKPIANVRVYVLDEAGEPVPRGVVGELYVAGTGIAAGYLDRPELNSERFVPSPVPEEPDAIVCRTRDLVRYRADGMLEFLGRADQQIKIRGFRVEPGEIEALLSARPDILECAVALEPTTTGGRLIAYLVPADGAELSASGLRAELSERLPHHMLPAQFRILDTLPRSRSGKVDRTALTPSVGLRLSGLSI